MEKKDPETGPKKTSLWYYISPAWIPYLMAVALGLYFGYDFGFQISGPGMGVFVALFGAGFCYILVESFLGKKRRDSSKSVQEK